MASAPKALRLLPTEEPGADGEAAPWGAPAPALKGRGPFPLGSRKRTVSPRHGHRRRHPCPGELATASESALPRKPHAGRSAILAKTAEAQGGAGRGSGLLSFGDKVKMLAQATDVVGAEG